MINIGWLYDTVNQLSKESVNGYKSNNQFNRDIILAEDLVYDYYSQMRDGKAKAAALGVFTKNEPVTITSGEAALPTDFRRSRNLLVWTQENGKVIKKRSIEYMGDEAVETEQNSIRQGKDGHFRHEIQENKIKIYPQEYNGIGTLRYYRIPVYANRVEDYDAGTESYNYNDSTSKHLEWNPLQKKDFVDVLLYLAGVESRDSMIVQFIAQKGALAQNIQTND